MEQRHIKARMWKGSLNIISVAVRGRGTIYKHLQDLLFTKVAYHYRKSIDQHGLTSIYILTDFFTLLVWALDLAESDIPKGFVQPMLGFTSSWMTFLSPSVRTILVMPAALLTETVPWIRVNIATISSCQSEKTPCEFDKDVLYDYLAVYLFDFIRLWIFSQERTIYRNRIYCLATWSIVLLIITSSVISIYLHTQT